LLISGLNLNFEDKLLKILHSSGDYEEYQYTDDNLLYKEALWNSVGTKQWIEYGYDGFGRETLKTYPATGFVETSYDGLGRKIQVSDSRNSSDNIGGSGDINYYYDALGRLSSYIDQDDYSIYYFYKADGQKETIKVFDNSQTPQLVYEQWYFYDGAGRLTNASCGDPLNFSSNSLAGFEYDDNGNRDKLTYYIEGDGLGGDTVSIDYSYNIQNQLTSFATTGVIFSFDADSAGDIDGLGRLAEATESIGTSTYALEYNYNDRSELTSWQVNTTTGSLNYDLAGNITNDGTDTYSYTGDLLTGIGSNTLTWDYNGALTGNLSTSIVRNADSRIQSAVVGSDSIVCKYTPDGDMVIKTISDGTSSATEKYILDITGKYPVVLLVLDSQEAITNEYYYTSNKEILSQHIGSDRYYYLKDRLGSVRAMIDDTGSIVNSYAYTPYGEDLTTTETVDNRFKFASYNFDETTDLYYLNARWYDPTVQRFTSRDPVRGSFQKPLALHRYLYCANDPINRIDPSGEMYAYSIGMQMRKASLVAASGVKGMAAGLVNSINAVNTMTASMLNTASMKGYFAATTAMQAGATMLHHLGRAGFKQMQMFAGITKEAAITGMNQSQILYQQLSFWARTNHEAAADVSKVLLGDPHLPSTPEGVFTHLSLEALEDLFGESD
jgi:RHS repeat-associated protein